MNFLHSWSSLILVSSDQANHEWPAKIIVFRDGVGDSQLSMHAKYEAEQFKDTFKHVSADYLVGSAAISIQFLLLHPA